MRGRIFDQGALDRVFTGALLGFVGVLVVASCGGVASDSGLRIGGHGAGSGVDGGGSSGSRNDGDGRTGGSRTRSGSTSTGSATGSGSSRGGDRPGGDASLGGAGGSSPTSGGASGSVAAGGTADLPDPPRTTDLLGELDQLHMDKPLATTVTEKCPTSLELTWDLDRDGTTDATESRLFDASGRLVAAELGAGATDGGWTARKRARITYDDRGRPTQYLYGIEGSAVLGPWISGCTEPLAGLPRGTVVDVDYSADGREVVRAVTTENCSPICETLVFDAEGQFRRRHRGCDGQNDAAFAIDDQVRDVDSQGRPMQDSNTVPPRSEPVWTSDIWYSYPAPDSSIVAWSEILGAPGAIGNPLTPVDLTKTLGSDGRIARMTMRATGFDDVPDRDVVTYTYDSDGCGVTESTDLWNDGVADIVTTTSCTDGRVTHQTERNMISTQDLSDRLSDRWATPLWAAPQSEVTLDVHYDARGRITERSFQQVTLQDLLDVNRTQHEVYGDDGNGNLTGKLDRVAPDVENTLFFVGSESSTSSCTVTNACGTAVRIDPERGRCEAGLGVTVVPTPYLTVPGSATMDLQLRGVPWLPVPAGFMENLPGLREVVGF